MTAKKTNRFLQVQDADDLIAFLRLARSAWRKAHPEKGKPKGRPSQTLEDLSAIKVISSTQAGISDTDFKLWTQADWIKAIGSFKKETAPGKAAIKKNLKQATLQPRFPLPIHLIPPTIVKSQSVEEQLLHWYAIALMKATIATTRVNADQVSISLELLDVFHRELCLKHMPTNCRPVEAQRKQWLADRVKRIQQIPISSRSSQPAKS